MRSAPISGPDGSERPANVENDVEDVIEGRVTAVLEDERLALEPPLFSDLGLVFPPVDFELDATPRVLASLRANASSCGTRICSRSQIPAEDIEAYRARGGVGERGAKAAFRRW